MMTLILTTLKQLPIQMVYLNFLTFTTKDTFYGPRKNHIIPSLFYWILQKIDLLIFKFMFTHLDQLKGESLMEKEILFLMQKFLHILTSWKT